MPEGENEKKDKEIAGKALKYIIDHKDELIKKFILNKKPVPINFLTFFMADV